MSLQIYKKIVNEKHTNIIFLKIAYKNDCFIEKIIIFAPLKLVEIFDRQNILNYNHYDAINS